MFDELAEKIKEYILKLKQTFQKQSWYIAFLVFLASFASLAFIPQGGILFLFASATVLVSSGCLMYKLFDDYHHERDFHISDRIKEFLGLDLEEKMFNYKSYIASISFVIFFFLCLFPPTLGNLFQALASLGLLASVSVLGCEIYESYCNFKNDSSDDEEDILEYEDSLLNDPDYYFIGEKMERSVDSLDDKWNEENKYMDKCLALSEKIENASYEGYEDDLDELYGLMQGYTFEEDLAAVYEEAFLEFEKNIQSKIGYSRQRKFK